MKFNFTIPSKALLLIVGSSALAGGLIGVFYENQRVLKETKKFLDKRATDERLLAAKNLGQTYILMFLAKMMNDRAQLIDTMTEEDKLAFQAMYKLAWEKKTDAEKLDAYRNIAHNLENEMSDEEKDFYTKVMNDIASI